MAFTEGCLFHLEMYWYQLKDEMVADAIKSVDQISNLTTWDSLQTTRDIIKSLTFGQTLTQN